MKLFNSIFEFFSIIFFNDDSYELEKQELKTENVYAKSSMFFFWHIHEGDD